MARKFSTNRTSNSGTLKDGVYLLQITDAEEVTARSGNEMIKLTMNVVVGGKPNGRTIFDNLVFTEKAQWKFDNLHDALEVEEGKEIDCRYYRSKRVYASLITDAYEGKVNNKVDRYLAPHEAELILGQAGDDLDDENSDDDDDLVTTPVGRAAAARQSSAAPAGRGRPRRAQPAELDEDDDMPL